MKDCGSCSMCCKFLEIPSLQKKADVWCSYCKPGVNHSCTIYEDRPEDCINFNCFWKGESWPDELRPDRCKVLFEALPGVRTVVVSTDKGMPDAWKKKKIGSVIETLRKKDRPVIVRTKNDTAFSLPEGVTVQDVMADIKSVLDRRGNDSSIIHNGS